MFRSVMGAEICECAGMRATGRARVDLDGCVRVEWGVAGWSGGWRGVEWGEVETGGVG